MVLILDILVNLVQVHIPAIFRQLCILLWYGSQAVQNYRHKLFADLLQGFPAFYNTKVGERKQRLFDQLKHLTSTDEDLKRQKQLRILEIGIGSGANLEYFPTKCHLIGVDPNPSFEQYFRENLEKFKGITLENYFVTVGEELGQIKSGSVDVVVTTLVTCSVSDINKIVSEIHRVLAPGGRYYFMEHIMYDDSSAWKHILQKFLNVTRIWPLLFDGCTFQSRHLMKKKCSQLFSSVNEEFFYIDTNGLWVLWFLSPHVSGVATK